ncbi:hypothetical protein DRP04_00775 [Archaeoglobales archaeon]|nr:MAG: hypothetical protein DRP04_00775 [Archaeoglobales archaeon]
MSVLSLEAVTEVLREYAEEEHKKFKVTLAHFTEEEVSALIDMVEAHVFGAPQTVRDLVSRSLPAIINCARAVKTAGNRQAFLGVEAGGNQFLIEPIDAEMFDTVWGASGATDFKTTLTSTGSTNYIGTSSSPESTSEEEGYVILGFAELSPTPKVNKALLTRNKDTLPYAGLDFDACGRYQIAALPEPWIIFPESNFYIQVNVYRTGTCCLKPIGYKVLQAKNALSL